MKRALTLTAITAFFWFGFICNPGQWALADLQAPTPQNNGVSTYTDYEWCHMDVNYTLHVDYTHTWPEC